MNFYIEELKKLKLNEPTNIQSKAFFAFDSFKNNLVINSKTGTGKTYSYLLPIKKEILFSDKRIIVILPTLELCNQTFFECQKLEIDSVVIDPLKKLTNKLTNKIIISTPQKIYNLIGENLLDIKKINYIVIDEADMVFSNDNFSILEYILKLANSRLIFISATFDNHLKSFVQKYFGSYNLVKDDEKIDLKYYLLKCENNEKIINLKNLIYITKPFMGLIFVNKIEDQNKIYEELVNDFNVCMFNSKLSVRDRKHELKNILDQKYQVVITSDVMARGIDFKDSTIYNFDIPNNLEYFIHRSGRTARAKTKGFVYTLVTEKDKNKIKSLENKKIEFIKIKIKNNEIIEIKDNVKKIDELYVKALKKVKKPKKVSPNYKKKNKKLVEQAYKKEKSKNYRKNFHK